MDNSILYTVKGNFVGNFITDQKDIVTSVDIEKHLKSYEVKIYEGEITAVELIKSLDYNTNQDFSFKNVDNIQIVPNEKWPLPNKRIFSFGEFILSDISIENSWFKNGKTYGILKGKVQGTVLKNRFEKNIEEKEKNKEDRPLKEDSDKTNAEDFRKKEKTSTDNDESNRVERQDEDNKEGGNRNVDNPPVGPGCMDKFTNPGCGSIFFGQGCFKWLIWLLLFLLLLLLLRECTGKGMGYKCFSDWLTKKSEIEKIKKSMDSLDRLLSDLNKDSKACSDESYEGTNKIVINNYILDTISGHITLEYNMKVIPDLLEVFYDGNLVASTYDFVSQKGELTFNYQYDPNKPDYFTVKVSPGDNPKTKWSYKLNCPKK
jgi:hypothetical protein